MKKGQCILYWRDSETSSTGNTNLKIEETSIDKF